MWGAQGWKGSREENCAGIIHRIRAEQKQVWLFSCTDIPKNNLGTAPGLSSLSSPHLLCVNKQLLLLALPVPPFN